MPWNIMQRISGLMNSAEDDANDTEPSPTAVIDGLQTEMDQYANDLETVQEQIAVEKMDVSNKRERKENQLIHGSDPDVTDDEVQRLREREQDLSGRHQAISKRIGELRSKKGQLDDMRIDLEMAAKMDTSWKDRLVNLRQSVKQETGEDEMPGTQLNTLFEGIDNMHSDLMGQQFPEWEYDDFTDVEDAAAQEYSIESNTE